MFDGVARSLPALAYAQHLARKAAKVGFDWPDVDGPLAKVDEELAELREAIAARRRRRASPTSSATSSSPPSTSPATSTSTPSWRCGPRRPSSAAASRPSRRWRRERGVDLRRRRPGDARRAVGRGQGDRARAGKTGAAMRLQFADPSDHPHLGSLPFATDLEDWDLPHMHGVLGLHRHVVRLVELGPDGDRTSYVVKELPDHLAQREYRLLRAARRGPPADGARVRRRHRALRRPRRAADHAPPRLLAAVPHAAVRARA